MVGVNSPLKFSMELVDTHCHLQFEKPEQNLDSVLQNARAAGVSRLLCVGTSIDDSQKAVELAVTHENIWAAVGAHPHDGKDFFKDPKGQTKLQALYKKPKVVAVGEVGLDFYKNYSPKEEQEKLLRMQIELGLPAGLPFIFHVREAFKDFWRIFDDYKNLRGVIHSFSASPAELEQVLSRDLFVALNGIMTFTVDKQQLAAAKLVPKDKLLLETDAPFLAPKVDRGKVCEPKHILDIANFLANLRGEDIKDLASYTTENAVALFKL